MNVTCGLIMNNNMQNNKPPSSNQAKDQPKKQMTEYELITQAIKIPENHVQLMLARLFYMAVCFAFPFWVMGHWR